MNKQLGILLIGVFAALPSLAEEQTVLFDFSDLEWFGNLSATYMDAGGDVEFHGNTASLYGGSPEIALDDGQNVSLAVGFQTQDGWRLSAELAQASLASSTAGVFGFDDRIDDTFRVDAEIESLLFMLNGGYDFDIGSDRFTPFFEGGVGVARNKWNQAILDVSYDSLLWNGTTLDDQQLIGYSYPDGENTEFAWSASLGLRVALSEQFDLALSYGFIDLGQAATGTDANGDALGVDDLSSQQLQLGLDFAF
ncbi:MAG: porin family protein [Gammaproteobacteria bacterium]|nr:porin family protein [Gammaproteobacteria bacterium]